MLYYAEIAADFTVVQQHDVAAPELEVADPAWRALPGPIDWSARPNAASVLKWAPADVAPSWSDPRTLDQARADKAAELSTACATHILGGFVSSALGAAYTYPSTILDQHNLNGLVTRSLYPGNPAGWIEKFWCADAAGVWARRDHTAAQLQQVGDEAIVRITTAQAKCDSKIAQANAATFEQLATLTWDSV